MKTNQLLVVSLALLSGCLSVHAAPPGGLPETISFADGSVATWSDDASGAEGGQGGWVNSDGSVAFAAAATVGWATLPSSWSYLQYQGAGSSAGYDSSGQLVGGIDSGGNLLDPQQATNDLGAAGSLGFSRFGSGGAGGVSSGTGGAGGEAADALTLAGQGMVATIRTVAAAYWPILALLVVLVGVKAGFKVSKRAVSAGDFDPNRSQSDRANSSLRYSEGRGYYTQK
jgi:hypothetical protein